MNYDELLYEGRKYFFDVNAGFVIKNKGRKSVLNRSQFCMELSRRKLIFVRGWAINNGIFIKRSTISESFYFNMHGVIFRVSDHKTVNETGITHNIVIKYDTCVFQVISFIESMSFRPKNSLNLTSGIFAVQKKEDL